MSFTQTGKSTSGTYIRRVGEGVIEWSRGVKPTTTVPLVYPQLVEGQSVTLDDTTGEIIAVPDATLPPLGVVYVANTELNDQRVTIMSVGTSVIRASAADALDFGEYVTLVGSAVATGDPNTLRPIATGAVAGNYCTGVVLTASAASGDEVEILVLSSPVKI